MFYESDDLQTKQKNSKQLINLVSVSIVITVRTEPPFDPDCFQI